MDNNEELETQEINESQEIEDAPSESEKLIEELKNDLALARADLYNYRQRVEKERAKLRASISEERILDFIPVLDNLDRALNVSEEAAAADILRGVQMVRRQFLGVLQELGVEPIQLPENAQFDPLLHDAVGTDDVCSELDGTVTCEVMKGYRCNEKILRPVQVRVGKTQNEIKQEYSE